MIAIPLDLVEQIPVKFGHPEKTETTLWRQNHPGCSFPSWLTVAAVDDSVAPGLQILCLLFQAHAVKPVAL
jgi:hypothetical protein